jgi:hypothetical protein
MEKVDYIFNKLIDLDDMQIYEFLDRLKFAYENEWDCNISGIENFGAAEFRIACKSAVI